MNKKLSIGLLVFILFLIVFDAIQQKYYVETFGLIPENEELSLGLLFKKHFIRWLIWGLLSLPGAILIWKKLPKNHERLTTKIVLYIAIVILFNIIAAIALISLYEIEDQQLSFSKALLFEFITFFVFQKGLTFLMASITLTMILYNRSRDQTIESQFVEITNLRTKSTDLEEALNISSNSNAYLNIKTGGKLQPISLSDIVWIESDDYCVKIHTENQAFTLRESMKSLEEKLAPHSFIRVHRAALLNLNYLHQINFDSATIKLSNTTELPLSKTGAKALKSKLQQVSL